MNNTSTSAPSRRGLFQGAAAAAVAAGIGVSDAIAGGSLDSPEFTEWQRLAMKARDWFASVRDGHITATQENEAAIDRLWDRMGELEEVIFKMPVLSVEDVMVLGIIALNWNADEAPRPAPSSLMATSSVCGMRRPPRMKSRAAT